MKRLYRENEERKRVIAAIEGRGGGANDNVSEMQFRSGKMRHTLLVVEIFPCVEALFVHLFI